MGMIGRKVTAVFLASLLAATLLAGCGGGAKKGGESTTPQTQQPTQQQPQQTETPKAEPVSIEFWGWWSSETRMPTINKIVDKWNSEHPDIQVTYTFVPFGEMNTKYLASVAGGNPPDMVVSPDIFTSIQRGENGQAMELSSLGALDLKDLYYPNFWDAVTTDDGKIYALPWVGETKFLYYNKQLFREAGLDPEKGPVTWDDLWTMAEKLDKWEGSKLVQMGFHPLMGNFGFQGWVWNAGGLLFQNDETPTINADKNVEVLEWIKKWTDRYGYDVFSGFKGSFGTGPQHAFIQGKIGMVVETATFEKEIKTNAPTLEYGVVPVPTPDGKQHQNASYSGGFSVELPVGSKHPQQALEFAKYWTQEAAVIWAQEQNDFPAYTKAVETITTPEFKRAADNMQYTGLIPVPLTASNYLDFVNPAVDEVLMGNMSAKAALDQAQSQIEDVVAENLAGN